MILVLDDDPLTHELFVRQLHDYQVHCCTRPTEALAFLAHKTPDLMLLDIHLSEGTGLDWADKFRSLGLKDAPILFISVDDSPETVSKTKKIRGGHFISKEDMDLLSPTVGRILLKNTASQEK